MDKRTGKEIWSCYPEPVSLPGLNLRIKYAVSQRGWEEAIRIVLKNGLHINKLKIAEVGCGTGTMALTFALMGASVTLIDFNQKALDKARDIFKLYGLKAEYINEDCLNNPKNAAKGVFDIVISSGLMEHFSGKYRQACLVYHKELLKNSGFVFIEVPNADCPWYQFIKIFRKLTKTWVIDIEEPFRSRELEELAKESGLSYGYTIMYVDLKSDLKDHVRGFISAVGEIIPRPILETLKKWKSALYVDRHEGQIGTVDEIRQYCFDKVKLLCSPGYTKINESRLDRLVSGLVLFAFKMSGN